MIAINSGAMDDCICIAVSGRQVAWKYQATQAKHFEQPSHRPTGAYAASLGEGASRFQRGHLVYQNMGHTAVFTRINGAREEPVVGFFPQEGLFGSLSVGGLLAHQGGAVIGAWHDDGWMFNDSAALAYEIPCSHQAALNARSRLQGKLRNSTTRFPYQTRQDPGEEQNASRNCVAAAMLILEELSDVSLRTTDPLDETARAEVGRIVSQMKQLLAGRGFLQGQMQQLVQTGFTHLPSGGE